MFQIRENKKQDNQMQYVILDSGGKKKCCKKH